MHAVLIQKKMVLALFVAWMSALPIFPVLAQSSSAEYTATTADDPGIPKDHLAILVTPLTLDELELEADAWMNLVREKVFEISAAEIAIKFKNEEIDAAEDTAEAMEEAQEALAEAEEAKKNAATDASAAQDARKAIEAAEEAAEQAREAAAAAEKLTQDTDSTRVAEEAEAQALERAAESAEENGEAPIADPDEVPSISDEAKLPEITLDNTAQLEDTIETAERVADVQSDVKSALLDNLNLLRDERTALVNRTRIVLADITKKGGDAEIREKYLAAVSGIRVDKTDMESILATISGWLVSSEGGKRWGLNAGKFLAILLAFLLVSRVAGSATNRVLRVTPGMSALTKDFLIKSARRVVLVIGLIVALTAMEVNIAPLLAMIGAAGFVVAFALQDTLSNFASGIMILVYRPFDVGDVVDVAGVSGKVTALNLVSVSIHTFDNKVMIVPNNSVWNDVITNATGSRTRRVDLVFGIGYQDDIAKTQSVLEQLVSEHELVLETPEPVIKVHELADSSVNFICRPWVKTADYWDVYWDLTRSVKERFDAEGISIPFPQRDVHIYNEGGGNSSD